MAMRVVICADKFVGDVVRRLVKYYERVEVVRYEANLNFLRVIATGARLGSEDDGGSPDPVVSTGFGNPPPNCS